MSTRPISHISIKTDLPESSYSWNKNPSVQKLLDAVIYILANEYVRAVKENPTLFSDKGDSK